MTPIAVTILCTFLGASGIFSFIIFLIKRHDDKRDQRGTEINTIQTDLEEIRDSLNLLNDNLKKAERHNVRAQLLMLMADYPDDTSEIMKCAEHYFKELDGNWYATPLFAKYLQQHGVAKPEWFLG